MNGELLADYIDEYDCNNTDMTYRERTKTIDTMRTVGSEFTITISVWLLVATLEASLNLTYTEKRKFNHTWKSMGMFES